MSTRSSLRRPHFSVRDPSTCLESGGAASGAVLEEGFRRPAGSTRRVAAPPAPWACPPSKRRREGPPAQVGAVSSGRGPVEGHSRVQAAPPHPSRRLRGPRASAPGGRTAYAGGGSPPKPQGPSPRTVPCAAGAVRARSRAAHCLQAEQQQQQSVNISNRSSTRKATTERQKERGGSLHRGRHSSVQLRAGTGEPRQTQKEDAASSPWTLDGHLMKPYALIPNPTTEPQTLSPKAKTLIQIK